MDSIETFQWAQLAKRQKIYIIAAAVLVVIIIGSLAFDSYRSWSQIHTYEQQAAQAERDKDEALTEAAKTASVIKVREEELAKVEVKRDAKKQEVDKAKSNVARDTADYERAVHARVPNAPSTDDLCARLAAAGHPCR